MVIDNLSAKAVVPILRENMVNEARVFTDEAGRYRRLVAEHEAVNHNAGEWGGAGFTTT